MVLLLQSWLVLTAGLLTLLSVVIGTQWLLRAVRRPHEQLPPAGAISLTQPGLRLVHSAA